MSKKNVSTNSNSAPAHSFQELGSILALDVDVVLNAVADNIGLAMFDRMQAQYDDAERIRQMATKLLNEYRTERKSIKDRMVILATKKADSLRQKAAVVVWACDRAYESATFRQLSALEVFKRGSDVVLRTQIRAGYQAQADVKFAEELNTVQVEIDTFKPTAQKVTAVGDDHTPADIAEMFVVAGKAQSEADEIKSALKGVDGGTW